MKITPQDACKRNREICSLAPVIPVLVVHDISTARPLAEALVAGGLPALEVTLRSPAALEAIRVMREVAGGVVGAGTLITPQDVQNAVDAGAQFGVSPGATDELITACEDLGLPLLAGAATATEAMRLLARGYDLQKFFPAATSGGPAAIRALGGPLPQISFCPTGGINRKNAIDYLAIHNVICVGGSWVAPSDKVSGCDWAGIEELAFKASQLRKRHGIDLADANV